MIDKRIKQAVVKEYLGGGISLRKLGKKYGVSGTAVNRWIIAYEESVNAEALAAKAGTLQTMEEANSQLAPPVSMAAEIKQLKEQLKQEQLHNRLLTAMIDIAEEELKIPIRKKYGTRQSKK
jgi:transposase-like protein